jgi:hypothetical protein
VKTVQEDHDTNPGPPEAAKAMVAKDKEIVNFPYIFEMKGTHIYLHIYICIYMYIHIYIHMI